MPNVQRAARSDPSLVPKMLRLFPFHRPASPELKLSPSATIAVVDDVGPALATGATVANTAAIANTKATTLVPLIRPPSPIDCPGRPQAAPARGEHIRPGGPRKRGLDERVTRALREASTRRGDRVARRVDDEPRAAELGDVLAGDLAGPRVGDVVVERVPVVGDLAPTAAALRRPEQVRVHARAGARPAARVDRGPGDRALPVAAALVSLLPREEVDRTALGVEQHAAVAAVHDLDRLAAALGRRRGLRGRRRGRCGGGGRGRLGGCRGVRG